MSIKYGVLVGRVIGGDREDNDPKSPHYTIFISGSEHTYRAPANVQSQDGSEVPYFHEPNFVSDPLTSSLRQLDHGFHGVRSGTAYSALDHVRGGYVDAAKTRSLPASEDGANNDLQDIIWFWLVWLCREIILARGQVLILVLNV